MTKNQGLVLDVLKLRDSNGEMGDQLFERLEIRYLPREDRFWLNLDCSDTFWWACGDLEEITEETYPVLEGVVEDFKPIWEKIKIHDRQVIEDHQAACKIAGKAYTDAHPDRSDREWYDKWGNYVQYTAPKCPPLIKYHLDRSFADLFAAKVRGMRPQGACYTYYPKELWIEFDQAGPEREIGFGNPYKPGEYEIMTQEKFEKVRFED